VVGQQRRERCQEWLSTRLESLGDQGIDRELPATDWHGAGEQGLACLGDDTRAY